MRGSRRRVLAVSLFMGVFFVVGVATAQWLATGSGSGFAQAGVAQDLTSLETLGSGVDDLYPGGTGTFVLRIQNPNPYPVVVSAVTGAGPITSGVAGCDPDHAVTFTDQTGLALAVAADGDAQFQLPGAVAMGASSPDACQGAVFTVPVTMSGYSGTSGDGPGDVDVDGDGFTPPQDCDDTDATVYPGAPELADTKDNDCDGSVDEDFTCVDDGNPGTIEIYDFETGGCIIGYFDSSTPCDDDNPATVGEYWDGTGNCIGGTWVDADGDSYTADVDCNDNDSTINPGATEILGNSIDENCNVSLTT